MLIGYAAWRGGSRGLALASGVAAVEFERVPAGSAPLVVTAPEQTDEERSAAARKRWAAEEPARREQEQRRREEKEAKERAGVCKPGAIKACTHAKKAGIAECSYPGTWSECGLIAQCQPGQYRSCGGDRGRRPGPQQGPAGKCMLMLDHSWRFNGCDTPLVLSFGATPVVFTEAPGVFDLRVDGEPPRSSRWVSAATPWLAIDLDNSGAIEDARELFGSATVLPAGTRAPQGFAALAAYDEDGDGLITARDPVWPRLRLWSDSDQDRRSSPAELSTLASRGVVSIELKFREDARCEPGACEVERGGFHFVDERGQERHGAVVDVHFALQ